MTDKPALKRLISLPSLILYGLGTMIGGGIYALLGEVAGLAGYYAPVAIFLSGLLALLTATSFAELSSRFPSCAGEAAYVKEGFGSEFLSTTVGVLVILTGVVSAATLSVAVIGFLQDFVPVPEALGIILLVAAMGLIAVWGIDQSVAAVVIITIIETGGLLFVVLTSGDAVSAGHGRWQQLVPPASPEAWLGIFSGTFLAFYAFLGFEDMVNMAEEVKNVRRNLPVAIMVSIALTMVLYLAVSVVAVMAVPPDELSASNTPLARIVESKGYYAIMGLSVVSLLAGLNGALVQILMASRVTYGMAKRRQISIWFETINRKTRTPVRATVLIVALVLSLALFLPLVTLAKLTSGIILVVFALVNLALWRVKQTNPDPGGEGPRFPAWIPLAGFSSCLAILLFQGWALLSAA